MRRSRPYTERGHADEADGIPAVRAGERIERDDGWWRVMRLAIWGLDGGYDYEVDWVPVEPGSHEYVCATTDEEHLWINDPAHPTPVFREWKLRPDLPG